MIVVFFSYMPKDWIGVIVEEGLKDVSVLDHVGVLERREKELGVSGFWTIIEVSVNLKEMDIVINRLEKGLRKGWYAYFKRGDQVKIVFKDKSFNIKKGSKASLTRVKNWAFKKYNILPEVFSLEL